MGTAATESGLIHHFSGTAICDPAVSDEVPGHTASSAEVSLKEQYNEELVQVGIHKMNLDWQH